jgi:hypothetical protein
MRAGAGLLLLQLLVGTAGCRTPPHVDLSLGMDHCQPTAGNPPAPRSCSDFSLACVNFVEARLYESDAQGALGRILGSSCVTTAELGQPADLCALQMGRAPFSLFSRLPDGKTVRFRIRALNVADGSAGCNVDLPGAAPTTLLFDGLSAPVTVDGNDHRVVIDLGVCASCDTVGVQSCDEKPLPPACVRVTELCPDGSRPLFPPAGCCGFCDPT